VAAGDRARIRRSSTDDLTPSDIAAIRDLLVMAFGTDPEDAFRDTDWEHALGGTHFVLELDGEIVGHASVVERIIEVDGQPFRTGYVEAVGVAPDHQGAGLGSHLMADVTVWIEERFELGALGTGRNRFYERLGWQTWRGPTSVRTPQGTQRSPDEDGAILVLTTRSTPPFDLAAPISSDWRAGDAW
jgi:aminoglycoside 2'-N-acetyltransferase I